MSRAARNDEHSVGSDLLKGAVAGALGVWVMDKVGWRMWDREDPQALDRELRARPHGRDVAHEMAHKAAGAVGVQMADRQPHPAGMAVHYALGVVPGAIYAAARRRAPKVAVMSGAVYGFALWALNDEAVAPLLGVAAGPTEYPPQAHVRGLVSHVALGVATDLALDAMDRADHRVPALHG